MSQQQILIRLSILCSLLEYAMVKPIINTRYIKALPLASLSPETVYSIEMITIRRPLHTQLFS